MSKLRIVVVAAALALGVSSLTWAADGAALFKTNCAKCHGATGMADTPAAKAMKVPALHDDANVKKMTAAEIAQKIKSGAKHPPPVKALSDADLEAAAAYVKTLVGK